MLSEDLLLFAADASRLMLESGGETYRAEYVAMGIIVSQGGTEAECFATSTGLMLSFSGEDGKVRSVVRRIKRHGMNLEKVYRIDNMVRHLLLGDIDIEEAARQLDEVERMKDRPVLIRMIASAFGAGWFSLLFKGKTVDALVAAAMGALLSILIYEFQRHKLPGFLSSFAGGAFAALASLVAAYAGLPINTDAVIIGVIMLLVPGVAITNAIRDTIAGDLIAGLARGVDAVITAAAISAGAGGAYALWRLVLIGGRA